MRIAVLGANGQVGAEVCLLLRDQPDIELIPICRNRLGSAFLRYHGVPVRHGKPADAGEAAALLRDCDVVVNFALGTGSLREASDANRRLVQNSIEFAPARARVLFFSTVTVYGDATPGRTIRWKNAYAREKLRCEQLALRLGRAAGKPVFVLRLGHVCGELQNITAVIRQEIAQGTVYVPDADRASNTTHTVTIVDAILKAARGLELPGLYDLLNQPQWTWRQVYEHEARVLGLPLRIESAAAHARVADSMAPMVRRSRGATLPRRIVGSAVRVLTASPVRKEMAMRVIARLSPGLNQRIQARYYQGRAAAEIAALEHRPCTNDALLWRPVGWRFLRSLAPTAELIERGLHRLPTWNEARAWPDDLEVPGGRA